MAMAKIDQWLRFFRLPNLPTAPGDAVAGACVAWAACGAAGDPAAQALSAGAAALFLYMYGLADNDIAGASADAVAAPFRPIPSGAISLRAARVARSLCWGLAVATGAVFAFPPVWWAVAAVLTAAIACYNRTKERLPRLAPWMMGLCRGLNVVCGACALEVWRRPDSALAVAAPVALVAAGWILYIAAVTLLSAGEERESPGIGPGRYLGALAGLVPLAACAFLPVSPTLPAVGCLWAVALWCAAVAPLGEAHASETRRRAVGRAIGALLPLQLGFMLVCQSRAILALALILLLSSRLIRKCFPSIVGS